MNLNRRPYEQRMLTLPSRPLGKRASMTSFPVSGSATDACVRWQVAFAQSHMAGDAP